MKSVTEWLKRELEGYPADDGLPDYRRGIQGTLVAWMPGSGWIEAPIAETMRKSVSGCDFYEAAPQLEEFYRNNRRAKGQRLDFSAQRLAELQAQTALDTRLSLAIPSQAYARTVEAVRVVFGRLFSRQRA